MRKCTISVTVGLFFLLSGCSLSRYYDGKTPIELEQMENPILWREVLQIQVALWPLEKKVSNIEKNFSELEEKVNGLEKKVDEMKEELAATRMSSTQANKNMESLHAEIQRIRNEFSRKEKTVIESPIVKETQPEVLKTGTTRAAGGDKKAEIATNQIIVNNIQYYNISDTQDRVLIHMSAMNNPRIQTLTGENPRIVLDFLNARNIDREAYEINCNGNFIKKIRIRSYKQPARKVRVVFDMIPGKKYSVGRKFSKKGNIYSFDFKAK